MGDSYTSDDSGYYLLAALFIILPLLLIFALAAYLISSFFFMKIFERAGVQGKWRAWVPVYNVLIAAKLGDVSPWVVLVAALASGVLGNIPAIGPIFGLIPVAVAVMYSYRIGLKSGKDWPLLLLWLIPGVGALIWLGIIAFSHNRWNPAIAPSPWAKTFLADKTVWSGIPVQPAQPVAGGNGGYGGPAYGGPAVPPSTGTTPPPPAPPAGPQV